MMRNFTTPFIRAQDHVAMKPESVKQNVNKKGNKNHVYALLLFAAPKYRITII